MAVGAVFFTVGLWLILNRTVTASAPLFMCLLTVVILATSYDGRGPGVIAAILGLLAGDYFFVEPVGSFAVEKWNDRVLLLAYSALTSIAILSIGVLYRARQGLEALRESELRFRTLAEMVPDIIFTADADGHYDFVNRRFYEFTGRSEGA